MGGSIFHKRTWTKKRIPSDAKSIKSEELNPKRSKSSKASSWIMIYEPSHLDCQSFTAKRPSSTLCKVYNFLNLWLNTHIFQHQLSTSGTHLKKWKIFHSITSKSEFNALISNANESFIALIFYAIVRILYL